MTPMQTVKEFKESTLKNCLIWQIINIILRSIPPFSCNAPSCTWTITGHSQEDQIPTAIHGILQVITLHPWTQQIFNVGMHVVEENVHICMNIDSLERRLDQQKVERQEKDEKTSNNILES